jgi:galactokinase/mevalonate kinase-like predicted kinase
MYGGSVLSCSVALRARVEVLSAPPNQNPTGVSVTLETNGEEYHVVDRRDLRPRGDRFDLARAILDYLRLPPLSCHLSYDSEIPMQSGLAGSTALVVAMLQALTTWQGNRISAYELAEKARYIELNNLKVVCGYQDACMCTFGGLNYMDFRGKQFYRQAESELFATIEPLAAYVPHLPFVLASTGVQHASSAVHKPLRDRWLEGEPAVVRGYRRITEIGRMGKKALVLSDWPALGRLMNENHAIQRDLGGSGESNERLIRAALKSGALGAKLAGAGDGGTIIALWPWKDTEPLERVLCEEGAAEIMRPEVVPGVTIDVDE